MSPAVRKSREQERRDGFRETIKGLQTARRQTQSKPEYYQRPEVKAAKRAAYEANGCGLNDVLRKLERKLWCVARAGGECKECGYRKHPAALQFHHRDPSTKLFQINDALGRSRATLTDVVLGTEVDKCDLLCANCHAIEGTRYTETHLAERGWF